MIELLAPAGNIDTFYAVINAGCDAVYVGGPKFGARAFAKNFTEEELVSVIKYANLHGKKVYMTFNILLKDSEFLNGLNMLIPFYEAGLHAVIIQDLGLIPYLREYFPGLEIHASTQMSVSNADGARFLKKEGVCRVVTSRELSLKEIKKIKDETGVEIESFIHGALCYSYSGQCLFSSFIGGRSGNRGRCAQPCRLPYKVTDENGSVLNDYSEVISMKDLCTINLLPDIIKAGVTSLKIEGRMKKASYAYTVTKIYRYYLDMFEKTGSIKVTRNDFNELMASGNRNGFTKGYYNEYNGRDMITLNGAAHESRDGELDEAVICRKKQLPIKILADFSLENDNIKVLYNDNIIADVSDSITEKALNKAMDVDAFKKQLKKTGDSCFEIDNDEDILITITGELFVPVSKLNEFRRKAFSIAKETLLNKTYRTFNKNLPSKNASSNSLKTQRISLYSYYNEIPFSILDREYINRVYVDLACFNDKAKSLIKKCNEFGIPVYLALPYVLRERNKTTFNNILSSIDPSSYEGFLVRTIDSYAFIEKTYPDKRIVTDSTLYTFSSYSNEYVSSFNNITATTMPIELSEKEIDNRSAFFSEIISYGYVPAMITANCVNNTVNGCENKERLIYMTDKKGFKFPVLNRCVYCTNLIFNSAPILIFNKKVNLPSVESFRLSFLNETKEEIENIFKLCLKNVFGIKVDAYEIKDFTRQHFKNGCE